MFYDTLISQISPRNAQRARTSNVIPTPMHTVLIVDDIPAMREILAAMLDGATYRLLMAANGSEALALAAEHRPDLILLDVMLPDMNGYDVCRAVRADPQLAPIPIIMITSLDDRASRLSGLEAGADDFVSKPFDRLELRVRVRNLTRLNRYRQLIDEQERVMAERARFAWVVDNADEGYLVLDAQGLISFANTRARYYLNLSLDEGDPIPAPFPQLIAQQYQQMPVQDAPGQAKQGQLAPQYLVQLANHERPALWLRMEMMQLPYLLAGETMVRLRDVTEQIEAEHVRWSFSGMVSHKLRTPLMGLLGGLHMLGQSDVVRADAHASEMAAIALNGARALKGAVERILAYTDAPDLLRSEDGCSLAEAMQLARSTEVAMQLPELRIDLPAELASCRIALPPKAVDLVLHELLDNSRKFHPEQTPHVAIEIQRSKAQQIRMRIYDDGLSCSPGQLTMASEPFYQGEPIFVGSTEGLGMGLAIVARLLWQIGGTFQLANRQDAVGIIAELHIPEAF